MSAENRSPIESADADVSAVFVIERITNVDSILQICLKMTGMGYGVVAHVTEDRWLACAVLDQIGFGLGVGGELPIQTTLCNQVRQLRAPIAFDHASIDDRWRDHHTPATYGLESYIAVPIFLSDGEMFGTLCAIDSRPAPASKPETVRMFELFAQLIALQVDAQTRTLASEAALLDAQETADLRDQFIAVLGHDLRNPLAAIEAYARLIKKRGIKADSEHFLEEILRSTGRMERLINDVLDFARGRLGGGLVALQRPTELGPVLSQVAQELEVTHPGREMVIEMSLGCSVECDPDRIAQLASNLLGNALTHGDPDAPVLLTARTTERAFVLAVTNGGEPIPDHIASRLFQPFTRGEAGEWHSGLGLGLYICSQIAKAHDGALTVSSIPGETRFEFRMPLTSRV